MQSVAPAPLPLQILLVDDDEDDRALTSDLVSQIRLPRRAELEWASSYEAGLEALGRKASDVCLLDYRLGARDGLDLLSEARSRGCICPIVILTGQGADGTDTRAMNLGADDYLVKGDLSVPLLERSIRYAVVRARHVGELRASEARYRRLFEAAKDGILILAADTGRIVDVNPFMTELTGYARQDFLGKHLWEIGPFKDTAASKDSFAELQARDFVRYDDLPLKTTDGRTVDVEFVSNVYRVDDAKVIQCNIRDITARKRIEDQLRMRDRAIQAVSQGILITDPLGTDHPIIYASPGVTRLTGYDAAEILGRNCRFLQGKDTDPASVAVLRDAIREERSCAVELVNYRKDGGAFWNNVALSPVRDAQGVLTNFVGVQTDVTARRQLEAQFLQAQKMEAVGRLAGGVAHDFNNLLSVVLCYAEMIASDLKAGDPMQADLEEIRTAALRATDLTRQLLAFSRQQVLETKVLNLNEVLGGMQKMLGRLLGADIEMTILPSLALGNVKVDPGQLEQIVMNLAVNARDAMPTGGQLTIETANVELDADYASAHLEVLPGSYVELAVSDAGTGMDKATLARIFEPFFTTKDKGKGTGLGLATVFGIVKQSGGHIFVYSEPAHGTTFRIYLPRVGAKADPATFEPPAPETERLGGTILLVEDEDQLRSIARTILRRQGYVVLDAANGGEALLICERHGATIDLLLTDVVLPRMSGRELAARLAPLRPAMKVLYMSGYTDDAILQHGIIDSGVAFLQKPITPTSLTRRVREVLRG
jgi:two-component system, cell cycle sensor histidine kinase and response regulator CckA